MCICKLIPSAPSIVGATNAVGEGMGGMHFVPLPNSTDQSLMYEAFLWHTTFPPEVTECLLTQENPKGSITNGDLELTVTMAYHDVIAS